MSAAHSSTTAVAPEQDEKPWHAAYPAPTKSLKDGSLSTASARELRERLQRRQEGAKGEKEFLVVDVRRTDFEEAFIRGAINLPAHSFYQTLPSLLPILSQYRSVIFHCQSSSGRGPRCAGWYQDALDEAGIKKEESEAVVLTGGIKEWIKLFGEEEEVTVKL
ncbi:hypothetical protein JCM10908_000481 [Rhodotorula pacifica]|uniref:uncharacterized protein n=1 Tax=Rhodotorula pacifica TaxID=1495444 RepID=UPI003177997C